jgi:undecaprenyl-diphosphatase
LVIAAVLLVLSVLPVERRSVPDAEAELFRWVNGLPDFLDGPISLVMQLGNFIAVPVVAAIALLAFRRWRVALDLAISGTAAWLLARVVKESVERGRPGDLLQDVILRDAPMSGLGFVSGHAAVAAALATVVAAYLGARWTVTVVVLAGVVAFARVYVGAHLPLDVVGGAAMGWALGSLVHFLVLPEITGEDPDEMVAREG